MTFDQSAQNIIVGYGQACGDCVPIKHWDNKEYKVINDVSINPKCIVTVHNTKDCSDPGIVSGPTCWTPEGGIAAYTVSCPWWPEGPTWENLKPCYH